MSKTILITGASSGFGKLTAKLFAEKGWTVIATMRNPSKEKELRKYKNIFITKLDVTDIKTIKLVISKTIKQFGKIDVLLNNAGYGLFGMLENLSILEIEKEIDTNLLGYIRLTKEVIPHMRKENKGMIINMSSILGIVGFPMGSPYSASKFAIEGFYESLHYELKKFNIRIKLVEPGNFNTSFSKNSLFPKKNIKKELGSIEKTYVKLAKKELKKPPVHIKQGNADRVANKIWKIANSNNNCLRYVIGIDAKLLNISRKISKKFTYYIISKFAMPKDKK